MNNSKPIQRSQTGKSIETLKIGDCIKLEEQITEEDVRKFAQITGDFNPVHIDEDYAKKTPFNSRICHGMHSASFISKAIGMYLPGPGTIYLSQEIKFLAPVRINEKITIIVSVEKIDIIKNKVILLTEVFNCQKEKVITGRATVKPPIKED